MMAYNTTGLNYTTTQFINLITYALQLLRVIFWISLLCFPTTSTNKDASLAPICRASAALFAKLSGLRAAPAGPSKMPSKANGEFNGFSEIS